MKWHHEIPYSSHALHGRRHTVNSSTFASEETWLELIETAALRFPFMHAAVGFAEPVHSELCKGKRLVDEADVVEIADVELDCADTYPLAM